MKRVFYLGQRGCGKTIRLNYFLIKRCLPWYIRPFYTYRYYLKHHVFTTERID